MKLEYKTGAEWILRETLGIWRDIEDEARTIVGCKIMLEALFWLKLVCIHESRFGSQLGLLIEAEPKIAEKRSL